MPMVASAATHKLCGFLCLATSHEALPEAAIDIAAQLDLLKQRGLTIQSDAKVRCVLEAVSFFCLTPYMRPFQQPDDVDHSFKAGTLLRDLTRLYDFDRHLRLLVMDAIERIEVATRAAISNHMGPIRGERGPLAGQVSTSRTTMPLNTARSL